MKSYVLTMFRLTRPLPPVLRWGSRLVYLAPGILLGITWLFIPHHWIFLFGAFGGLLAGAWQTEATKTIRRAVVQMVAHAKGPSTN